MTPTVADVVSAVDRLWPVAGAEPWDAVGLVAGDPSAEVSSILLAVDAVLDTTDEALSVGADLLLVHHPLLLRGVTSVAADRYKGAVLTRLIRGGCALLAAHTNADVVARGTSAALATAIGLEDARPLVPGTVDPSVGLGRVGRLDRPVTLGALARALAEVLPATATGVRVAGEFDRPVRTIALCAGAGDSLLSHPDVLAADVYITSDLRHHPASEAVENARVAGGPALIDVSHWASEWLWLDAAASELRAALPGVEVAVSDLRTDPWDFVVTQ
ncbi:Nif3-like dinuclear metal center hexameric protein [Salinibacterium soli]|uniref:GTP cyclohydrolase 1 type 2 homolog n=1 Tax=Antiquaquibacter soli TaxID=3064523 RepID=A0ABT9BM70_9MICO|nr:Nif3-like dinuclear metal center hexameric protein [Protaetiibacter sp. WY-16]MDO7882122.1 Nif3-like dinuclear metal center hexameric protein [Protaetiibacter sp. WY-16]